MDKFNKSLLLDDDIILVALSGGADSIACLYYLHDNFKSANIMAFHLNHKLRTDADSDMLFCQEVCKKLEITIFIEEKEIAIEAKKMKKSLEETGRIVRYKFLKYIANKHKITKIVTAHHADDNNESILMQIFNGTGGLHLGVSEVIKINNKHQIIRPMLNVRKNDIYQYCVLNKISFREDSTNLENDFKRNKLRNIIIPLIKKQINSNLEKSLEKFKTISDEMSSFIDTYIEKSLAIILVDNKYSITKFKQDDVFIRKEIINLLKHIAKYSEALRLESEFLKYNS